MKGVPIWQGVRQKFMKEDTKLFGIVSKYKQHFLEEVVSPIYYETLTKIFKILWKNFSLKIFIYWIKKKNDT